MIKWPTTSLDLYFLPHFLAFISFLFPALFFDVSFLDVWCTCIRPYRLITKFWLLGSMRAKSVGEIDPCWFEMNFNWSLVPNKWNCIKLVNDKSVVLLDKVVWAICPPLHLHRYIYHYKCPYFLLWAEEGLTHTFCWRKFIWFIGDNFNRVNRRQLMRSPRYCNS